MTITQKVFITTVLAAAIGTGIYKTRQTSASQSQIRVLYRQQPELTEQYVVDRDEAAGQITALRAENERLKLDTTELLRLRNEVSQLRAETRMLKQTSTHSTLTPGARLPAPVPVTLGNYILKERLEFAGYATPEAALQSSTWTLAFPNDAAQTDALGPKLHDEEGKAHETLETLLRGMQMLARKKVSDEEVEIKYKVDLNMRPNSESSQDIALDGEGISRLMVQSLIKVGNEWKLGDPTRRWTPEWDADETIQSFVP